MFFGEYRHTLDEKNRVLLPLDFRNLLGETFIATIGAGGSLMVIGLSTFTAICKQLAQRPLGSDDVAHFSRMFASGAEKLTPDKQGRVLLPQNLRKFAKLERNVVIAGVINRVEIWQEQAWEAYTTGQMPRVDATLDALRLQLPMPGEPWDASCATAAIHAEHTADTAETDT